MTTTYAIEDAKDRLPELVSAAQRGERIVLTQDGKPAAELVGMAKKGGLDWEAAALAKKAMGIEGSMIKYIAPDFDDPIDPEDFLAGKI